MQRDPVSLAVEDDRAANDLIRHANLLRRPPCFFPARSDAMRSSILTRMLAEFQLQAEGDE
jgi:hypothetical protein